MPRVDAMQSVCQPPPLMLIQRRQDGCEVGVVFRLIVLRLEQEHDFRNHVRNPVLGDLDDLGVGTAERVVATTDPHIAVVWISEDVKVVDPGRSVPYPCLVHHIEGCLIIEVPDMARANDVEVELRKCSADLGEPKDRDGDLRVLMDPGHYAEEEVDRPASRDAPWDTDSA